LIENNKIKNSLSFNLTRANDQLLENLDKQLNKNRVSLSDMEGLILTVKDAGMTQVKVVTAIINTFAWQLGISVAGKYYYKNSFQELLQVLLEDLISKKQKSLQVEYRQNPDISVSKKVPKYVIKK